MQGSQGCSRPGCTGRPGQQPTSQPAPVPPPTGSDNTVPLAAAAVHPMLGGVAAVERRARYRYTAPWHASAMSPWRRCATELPLCSTISRCRSGHPTRPVHVSCRCCSGSRCSTHAHALCAPLAAAAAAGTAAQPHAGVCTKVRVVQPHTICHVHHTAASHGACVVPASAPPYPAVRTHVYTPLARQDGAAAH